LAVRPLVMLGQASLRVFCVHLLFCFGGLTLLGNATMLSGWSQALLYVGTLSAMLVTAKIFSKSEGRPESNQTGHPQPPVRSLKPTPNWAQPADIAGVHLTSGQESAEPRVR
jgi:hypothetical protein